VSVANHRRQIIFCYLGLTKNLDNDDGGECSPLQLLPQTCSAIQRFAIQRNAEKEKCLILKVGHMPIQKKNSVPIA